MELQELLWSRIKELEKEVDRLNSKLNKMHELEKEKDRWEARYTAVRENYSELLQTIRRLNNE